MSASDAAQNAAKKFDPSRAAEYDQQSRIALAGYDACHELAAGMLIATLGENKPANVLIVGAGTGQEMLIMGKVEKQWRFTAVDPSPPMVELGQDRVAAAGLSARTEFVLGTVEDLPRDAHFDAATLIGVLHHLPGEVAKHEILNSIAARLKPGAPLILAGNRTRYAEHPLLLTAWRQRWRINGASTEEIDAKIGKILQGADPPASDQAIADYLAQAGFNAPTLFFSSLFWGAWIALRQGAPVSG
ncbi:MAG: class I SAM-dependent methyltransferase [Rhodospirillales bacterium]